MRVALIIHALQCGGAERVLTLIANYWVENGYTVDIITMDDGSEEPFYPLHSAVNHHPLNLLTQNKVRIKAYYGNIKLLAGLRRAIRRIQPDIIISFIDIMNLYTIVSTIGLKIPIIVSERSDPFQYKIGRHWEFLRHRLYPFADAIVVQSNGISSYFSEQLHEKISVISNPVFPPKLEETSSYQVHKPSILAIGRFTFEKGFSLLIKAFSSIHSKYPDWHLTIAGDGPLRQDLELLREKLSLQEVVHLPGRISDIYNMYAQADIFVLSSLFEGFPNVLCEAMASGLPVIATECSFGPIEIVRHNIDGLKIPPDNIPALSEAMQKLIVDQSLRKNLGMAAREILDRYNIDSIMHRWDELLHRFVKN